MESYWENRYHHFDRPTGKNDAEHTLYSSLSRLATMSLMEKFLKTTSSCHLEPTAVLQCHSYHKKDIFQVNI